MGRRRLSSTLNVWMNGELVGTWQIGSTGQHEFTYAQSWLEHPAARPISLSLPLLPASQSHRGAAVEYFFENLLPDNRDIRQRIQQRFSARGTSAFDLLVEIGRDCVGALQILTEDAPPEGVRTIQADEITDSEVAQLLREAAGSPELGRFSNDTFRISIAGAQEKTALLRLNDRWCIPLGSTPTSHIFKLPLGTVGRIRADLSASVENEWLCSRILHAYGQEVAQSEMLRFEDQSALVVERFDRKYSPTRQWIMRLLQEDMCQVHGIAPEQKYESEGGPGIEAIMRILLGSENAESDRRAFFRAQILFWLICAIDGHAKNFSVFIGPEGRFSQTPLYDVMSAYPIIGRGRNKLARQDARMAMAVSGTNRHYRWDQIQRRHWEETAARCGFASEIDSVLEEIVSRTPAAIQTVEAELPNRFPSAVSEPILEGLLAAMKRIS
ncbi:MAG: type II toxin-antitoxin system HipA family toxin [Bacteroidota bacterium]